MNILEKLGLVHPEVKIPTDVLRTVPLSYPLPMSATKKEPTEEPVGNDCEQKEEYIE